MPGTYTYQEILSQADAWNDALRVAVSQQSEIENLWQQGRYEYVVFTGCGSTHYLAQTAAALFQTHSGVLSRAVPASELLLHPATVYVQNKRTLLVTISRSGLTTETILAAQEFAAQQRGQIVVISCYDDKPLNEHASLNLVVRQGQEISVAQTRSFSGMLVLAECFARIVGGQSLSKDVFSGDPEALVQRAQRFVEPFIDAQRYQRYFYLGSGVRYGLAAEAMLKMKEMSLTSAEVFHPLEFRHGPKSMVDAETVIVGLLSQTAYNEENAVLNEMQALGATVVRVGPLSDMDFTLPSEQPMLVHTMPVLQWLAFQRAVGKGLDPDRPRNLDQVVQLVTPNTSSI
jgi:glutamine---fructose-6-phosphate transaminase (isomerizing)